MQVNHTPGTVRRLMKTNTKANFQNLTTSVTVCYALYYYSEIFL